MKPVMLKINEESVYLAFPFLITPFLGSHAYDVLCPLGDFVCSTDPIFSAQDHVLNPYEYMYMCMQPCSRVYIISYLDRSVGYRYI